MCRELVLIKTPAFLSHAPGEERCIMGWSVMTQGSSDKDFLSLSFFQVVLINAVRDVAKALAELISATKFAAGKAADDPSMYQLKSAAKVLCACLCLPVCE